MFDVLKVVLFTAFMHCGYTSSRVVATLYALHLQQPAWTVGLIISLYSLIPTLIAIHVGKWIDIIGVRIPIIIAALMIAAGCLTPNILDFETFGIWPIFLTCILVGPGFLFALISSQGLIGHLSTPKNRATAFTYQSIAFSCSNALGPVIAGYLIEHGSYQHAFSASFTYVLIGALIFAVTARSLPATCNSSVNKKGPSEHRSIFGLFAYPKVRNILMAAALVSMAWDLQGFMIPVYGTDIGLSAIQIGWLLSTFSIATFAVRIFMPLISRLLAEWQIILTAILSAGTLFMIFPIITSLPCLFVIVALLGASLGSSQPNVMSLLHQETPEGRIGEANGVRAMIMNASHTIFPLLLGVGGTVASASVAFWSLGTTMLGGGVLIRQSNKRIVRTKSPQLKTERTAR